MLSLDLLVSLIGLVMVGGALASLGFIQAESAISHSLQFKAESMAMAVGSAINNFDAINPETGSNLTLNLSDPEPISSNTLSSGWPPVGRVSFDSCKVSFESLGLARYVVVNISFYRWDSNMDESVIGKYPIVHTTISGQNTINCNGTIIVDHNMNVRLYDY